MPFNEILTRQPTCWDVVLPQHNAPVVRGRSSKKKPRQDQGFCIKAKSAGDTSAPSQLHLHDLPVGVRLIGWDQFLDLVVHGEALHLLSEVDDVA